MANEFDMLISAMAKGLKDVTTQQVSVRTDRLDQDLEIESPVFFISLLRLKPTPWTLRREKVSMLFDVRFHPPFGREEDQVLLAHVCQAMAQALKRVTLSDGSTKKGLDIDTNTVDNVSHAKVRYEFMMTPKQARTLVKALELDYGIKEG